MKVIIQIQKGKKEMYKEEYMDVYKKAGTAQVLHLIKPWHGTGRAVYAYSAFASKLKSFIIVFFSIYITLLPNLVTQN